MIFLPDTLARRDSCVLIGPLLCLVAASVSGRRLPQRAVVGREPGSRLRLQAGRAVAAGGFPLRADPVVRGAAGQRLQDCRGGPRAALRNANGWFPPVSLRNGPSTFSRQRMKAVLPPSAGDGHRQADEGLHQPDRQEALQQLPVSQQPQQPVQRLVKTSPQGALLGAQTCLFSDSQCCQNTEMLLKTLWFFLFCFSKFISFQNISHDHLTGQNRDPNQAGRDQTTMGLKFKRPTIQARGPTASAQS